MPVIFVGLLFAATGSGDWQTFFGPMIAVFVVLCKGISMAFGIALLLRVIVSFGQWCLRWATARPADFAPLSRTLRLMRLAAALVFP